MQIKNGEFFEKQSQIIAYIPDNGRMKKET
jgi:hypothetical protein